jgi:arylsulfatase A-like enzyme
MLKRVVVRLLALLSFCIVHSARAAAPQPRNVILIVADDLGYSDVGCFAPNDASLTPKLDQLASGGLRFTQFYVSQAVCTASRAAFLTGSYANRVGLQGALNHTSRNGIHPDEYLMPEMFKDQGWATAAFGKWHLGTLAEFNPVRHGFDEFAGIPYSNDNSKYHPTVPGMPPLPWYEGLEVSATDIDQSTFTQRITDDGMKFMEKHKDERFFLYLPHVMPHVPIFASAEFAGRTGHGVYADVIAELDDSIGRLTAQLEKLGLLHDTLIVFFSDNGPFLSYGDRAGTAHPLREGKLTCFEGGMRVPCIMHWPAHIKAGGKCDQPVLAMDLLPTFTELISGKTGPHKIDGKSLTHLLGNPSDNKPLHEAIYFYSGTELQAIRSGRWKLHFAHKYLTVNGPPGTGGKPANFANMKPEKIEKSGVDGIASRHGYRVEQLPESLFDLESDPSESKNLIADHPDVVTRLKKLAEQARYELGDSITGEKGKELRPVGVF